MSHKFRVLLRSGVLVGVLLFPLVLYPAPKSPPIISRITIRATDVFDLDVKKYLNRFPYTWINFLHLQTKDHVIRNALLFKVGDPLDIFLLRETERNLRAFSFIAAARIVVFPQRDGTVALVVHTNDAWTTEPQINMSGVNQLDKFEIGIKEKNFLGLGKRLEYFYSKENGVFKNKVAFFDPQVLGSRWNFEVKNISANNGYERSVSLQRPYYSTDARWSMGGNYIKSVQDLVVFQDNLNISEYEQRTETSEVFTGAKLNKSRKIVHRAGLRYQNQANDYELTSNSAAGQILPEGLDYKTIFLDWESLGNRYIEATRLEKMTRIEDINLGGRIKFSPGYSPRSFTGRGDGTQYQTTVEKIFLAGKDDYFQTSATYYSRQTEDAPEDQTVRAFLKYYYRKWKNQTLVIHGRGEWIRSRTNPNSVILGSENGLRAFENEEFNGNKSALFNLEDRFFIIDDMADLVSLGSVVYYDAGYAWDRDQRIKLRDVKSDVGAGLRIGLTKSSNEMILRFDVSYRLQREHADDTRWVFSFGSDQAF